jgi:integrase
VSNKIAPNQIYNDNIYNEQVKNRFMEEISDDSKGPYERIFIRSSIIEASLNRDMYDFNIKEIENVLFHLKPKTAAASKSNISIISSYIDWAIEEGYRSNTINPMRYQFDNWAEKFLDDNIKLFYTNLEIDEIITRCINEQDAVIISLLFYGASGREVSELRNLRISDVNFETCEVTLIDDKDNQTRIIKVPSDCISLIKNADMQTNYYKRNGHISPNSRNTKEVSELIETGYVIKPAKTKTVHLEQVNTHLIYARLSTISEIFNLENFTVKNIQRSGMLYHAKQIFSRDGKFGEKEQYLEICEQFGVGKVNNNGYEGYNWHPMKEYINMDMIKQLYNENNLS